MSCFRPHPTHLTHPAHLTQFSDARRMLRASRTARASSRSYRPQRSSRRRRRTAARPSWRRPIAASRSSAEIVASRRWSRARSIREDSYRSRPALWPGWPTAQPEAADAAVGKDVEAHVGDIADRADLVLERVARVRLQRRPREQLEPFPRLIVPARLEAARARRVPFEMARVDLHPPNRSFRS